MLLNQIVTAQKCERFLILPFCPVDPEINEILECGFQEQARRKIENVQIILEGAASSQEKVLVVTISLTDKKPFTELNSIYAEHFTVKAPVHTTVSRLPFDIEIEIDVIAHFYIQNIIHELHMNMPSFRV